jgi:hypothetical protein
MYSIKVTNIQTKESKLWTCKGSVRVTNLDKAQYAVDCLNYGPMAGTKWIAEVISLRDAVA